MFNFMKKGVGAIERDREKLDRDKERRKKDKKQRKEITSIPGSMSSEELLRLDEVDIVVYFVMQFYWCKLIGTFCFGQKVDSVN